MMFDHSTMPLLWDFCTLADRVRDIFAAAEADLRLEQAVYGLDAREELAIHEMLASNLTAHYDVTREAPYPSAAGKLSGRLRCDLVLTPKGRPLRTDKNPADLFTPPDLAGPGEALWLEIKLASQFREGGMPHAGYGQQWRNAIVEDLKKMEADPVITEAGLLLIVFNESAEILEKDLQLFEDVLTAKEVLAGFRQVRSVPILDRIGHRLCTAAVWPTIQRPNPEA
jgi:hypothetical protein